MTPDPLDLIARGNVWRQGARDVRRGPNDTAITVDTATLYTRGLIYLKDNYRLALTRAGRKAHDERNATDDGRVAA